MSEQDEVVAHYNEFREENRLADGAGQLELIRTQEILRRHLPPPPCTVLDVGGATGAHAEWLLHNGYTVHLVDLTPRLVSLAASRLADRGLTAEVGDARALAQADDSFDVVLLLGPLYHLQAEEDRLAALAEARRAVRPGGIVAVAAVNRFASIFDGLARGFIFDAEFRDIVARDLQTGCHLNVQQHPEWFTTAFFHRPEQLADEIAKSGLSMIELVGLEGLAGWLPARQADLRDPGKRQLILDALRSVESEPSLLGLSSHLLAVARSSQ